ncbi:RNA polymerase-interacting CarD/CdnL/TRCF family regulator [Bradyrhizobium sp. LB1.3]
MPNKTAKPAAKATVAKPVAAKPPVAKPATKPAVAKAPAAKPAAAKVAAAPAKAAPVAAAKPVVKPAAVAPKVEEKKVVTQRQGFKANEFVVYPAHGVGQILAIEEQEIAGAKLELFVINFIKDKMTLRVPTAKVANVGMRKLSDPALVKRALETLKGRARVKRTMWSRRAQEYEAKINSGDIVAIAEVVRDLYRFRVAARAVLQRTPALRSSARPSVPRDRGGAALDRDRSGQGDRGPARQEPAPHRRQVGSRRRRGRDGRRGRKRRDRGRRRHHGRRRGGVSVSRSSQQFKARPFGRAFCSEFVVS